jgi:hypothetical protein
MKFFASKEQKFDALQLEIDSLFSSLAGFEPHDKEYDQITNQLVKLKRLQAELSQSSSWRPSPDALIGAAGSLLGIVLILNYEKLDNITSKAVGFVAKSK